MGDMMKATHIEETKMRTKNKLSMRIFTFLLMAVVLVSSFPITALAAPASPTITAPANNASVQLGNVTVSGNNPGNGSIWIHLRNLTTNQRVDLGSGAQFGHRVSTGGSSYSFTIQSGRLVAGNRYRVSIECSRDGKSSWAEREFSIQAVALANPTITAPANNVSVPFGNVTVSGSNPSGGSIWIHLRNLTTNQRVDLGSGAQFGHRVSTGGSTYSFTIQSSRLVAGNRYRLSIECSKEGLSSWAEREFSVQAAAPANPTITAPANNASVPFGNVTVSGNNPGGGSIWIHLRNLTTDQRIDLGSGAQFGHRVSTGGSSYTFTIPISKFAPGNRYRMTIECNRDGTSSWAEREFSVQAATPANPTITAPTNKAIVPPANLTVSGSNPSNGSVWIHLRDITAGENGPRIDLGSGTQHGHRIANSGMAYSFSIPSGRLTGGRSYRIAIESRVGDLSSWAERDFTVQADPVFLAEAPLANRPTEARRAAAFANITYTDLAIGTLLDWNGEQWRLDDTKTFSVDSVHNFRYMVFVRGNDVIIAFRGMQIGQNLNDILGYYIRNISGESDNVQAAAVYNLVYGSEFRSYLDNPSNQCQRQLP
jgi:hypothetical protein